MLTIIELYREGFNEKVSIGESIEYMGDKYIIIRILEVKKYWGSKSISLMVRVLVQKVGEPSNFRNYKKEAFLTKRYNQSKDDKRIIKTGEIIFSKEGIAYEVVSINFGKNYPQDAWCEIKTLEGVMVAKTGDYIIQGVEGEIYPCKPDIFEKTYEVAEG
ncbi:hypothetical protein ACOY2N_12660 [Enterococcus faecium]|uniref:hypothetical protein n=1 Tax=Enterococcus faecium TaxID=1352 RepID=UPI003CE5C3A8